MKLTYEQQKVLAGMTVEGKLMVHNKKGKYLKPTSSKRCPELSLSIQGPQQQSPVLMEHPYPICRPVFSLLRVPLRGKRKSFSISA